MGRKGITNSACWDEGEVLSHSQGGDDGEEGCG